MKFSPSLLPRFLSLLGALWQQPYNGTILRLNITILCTQFLLLIYKSGQLPPQIPLYYSLPWGSQLASTSDLLIIPVYCLIILILDNFLAAFSLAVSRLISKLLVIFSLLVSLFGLVALLQIVFLVT